MEGWTFLNERGDFTLKNPHLTNYLYFPLANEAGMMSSISPLLQGDLKTDHHTFLLAPITAEDLHISRSSRNFWVYLTDSGPWSAAGNSAPQAAGVFMEEPEEVSVTAGFLWHMVKRVQNKLGLSSEITNFVPIDGAHVELMRVRITNLRDSSITVTPTSAIPFYCRSADNLRDHRHVTSLLHRIHTTPYGVVVQPAFCFDERGHKVNRITYAVLGCDGAGRKPLGSFPVMEQFIGEGGSLVWPETVVKNAANVAEPGITLEGYEAIGALRFCDKNLAPGETASYILALAIGEDCSGLDSLAAEYCSDAAFERHLRHNQDYWQKKLDRLSFHTGDSKFNGWLKWVNLQPFLRRIYGCSFLPHHDYGKGGRGWRDLWQDCLALLLSNPTDVRNLLYNNYAGIRMDGSNATIIGSQPGEFHADRNNIHRVWMDHGAWPFLTTRLYIDRSGDLSFLLEEQTYFKDSQAFRAKALDSDWQPDDGYQVKQRNGEVYHGSILEHILVQLVTQFFNVGGHNHIRLESADWNDALDMAGEHGESVAFTALYGYNLMELSKLLMDLQRKLQLDQVELAVELLPLCDTFSGPIDYDSVTEKRDLLERFFAAVRSRISGVKATVDIRRLAEDLQRKACWLRVHLRRHEWLENAEGFRWFNGYYDNNGERVEGDYAAGVRMTLTGQVFAIMGGIADEAQVGDIIQAVDRYLKDPILGGYRLNTDFGGMQTALGRAFGFAYGHKENGAMFSHMAVMYANALYQRGFVRAGFTVLDSIYRLSSDFRLSRIYPGIPEYINAQGRGMYHYLTGSASWYLMTMLNEVYGVKGYRGDLVLEPKLVSEQFDADGTVKVRAAFAGKDLEVIYNNPRGLEFGSYDILEIMLDGKGASHEMAGRGAMIRRGVLERLGPGRHQIVVTLGQCG